jgi:hypothetical protein
MTQCTVPGGHGTEYGLSIPTLTEPEEAQAFIDARIVEGSDYIKIMYDNGSLKINGPEPTLRKETMAALIIAAHLRGKRTVVHVLKLQDALDAIEVGTDGLAHVFVDQRMRESRGHRSLSLSEVPVPFVSLEMAGVSALVTQLTQVNVIDAVTGIFVCG